MSWSLRMLGSSTVSTESSLIPVQQSAFILVSSGSRRESGTGGSQHALPAGAARERVDEGAGGRLRPLARGARVDPQHLAGLDQLLRLAEGDAQRLAGFAERHGVQCRCVPAARAGGELD